MSPYQNLDAHAKPPEGVRLWYKKYQKMTLSALDSDADIFDFNGSLSAEQQRRCEKKGTLENGHVRSLFKDFLCHSCGKCYSESAATLQNPKEYPIFELLDVPGLLVLPSLLPPDIQLSLLNRLMHRDLSIVTNKTNVHTHYAIPYPAQGSSFFSYAPNSKICFTPHDPGVHKPLSIQQFLNKKLRWVTLGGQYDWTMKVYPTEQPPAFPRDIAMLLEGLFPDFKSEAAIVNFYSPGDTLSMHRDVSEECDKGLVSISLGCDGIFVIATEDPHTESGVKCVSLRLRTGDAVYMTGASRFAWHGVPLIIPNTCPGWLNDWPAGQHCGLRGNEEQYDRWRGWMASKRINLNVRQIWDFPPEP